MWKPSIFFLPIFIGFAVLSYGQANPEIELPDVEIVGEEGSRIESDKERVPVPEAGEKLRANADVDLIELGTPTEGAESQTNLIGSEISTSIDVVPNPTGPVSRGLEEVVPDPVNAERSSFEGPGLLDVVGPFVGRDVDAPVVVRPQIPILDPGFRPRINLPDLASLASVDLALSISLSEDGFEAPAPSPFENSVENVVGENGGDGGGASAPVYLIPAANGFTRLSVAYGPFNLLDLQGNYGAQSENLFIALAVDRRRTDTQYPDRGEGRDEVGGRVEIKLGPSSQLTVEPSYFGQTLELKTTGSPSAATGTGASSVQSQSLFQNTHSFSLPLSAQTEFIGGSRLEGKLSWVISSVEDLDFYQDNVLGGEAVYFLPFESEGEGLSLGLGGHFTQLTNKSDQVVYGAIIYDLLGAGRWRWEGWSFDLGGRFDHAITSYNSAATEPLGQTGGVIHSINLSPLIEIAWRINDNLSPYLSSVGSLSYPSLEGLYVKNRYVEVNPLTSAEIGYIDPLELGLRLSYGDLDLSLNGKIRVLASFIRDFVIWTDNDDDLLLEPGNVGDGADPGYVLIYGGGGDFEVSFLKNWTILGGGVFKIYRNLNSPDRLIPYRPNLEAEGGLRYSDEALGLTSELKLGYTSSVFVSQSTTESLSPFGTLQARVGKEIIESLEIFLAGNVSSEHEIVKGLKAPIWEVEAGAALKF